MLALQILLAILLCKNTEPSLFSKTNLTTPHMIEAAGYPIEEHDVTTEDGYVLKLHRIPFSPKRGNAPTKRTSPIAIMMHGIIASSADWVGAGPGTALGYLLADEGFDVWLANSRGNRYSEKHTKLDATDPQFWNFSFHEMGIYDLPAIFQYVHRQTGLKRFRYFAHSQGATDFFVLCSTFPEYNAWIIAAHLLPPIAYVSHIRLPFATSFATLLAKPNDLTLEFGSFNVLPNSELFHLAGSLLCNDYSIFQWLCAGSVYLTAGNSNHFNASLIPVLSGVYPAGSSLKQYQHFLQMHESRHFRPFEYTEATNRKFYNQSKPPDYNLTNINVPLFIYYGENDFYATPTDILYLISRLPAGIVRGIYKVQPEMWNHIDFLYGMNVKEVLYDRILADVRATF